jgi:hypothetical protein
MGCMALVLILNRLHAPQPLVHAETHGPAGAAGAGGHPVQQRPPVAPGVIVAGSSGLVRSTLTLADAWGLPHDLVRVFVLAGLTGLPNAYRATQAGLWSCAAPDSRRRKSPHAGQTQHGEGEKPTVGFCHVAQL